MPLVIGPVTVTGRNGSADSIRWVDEFGTGSDLVGQVQRVSLTGDLVFQASAQTAGRLLTLVGEREGRVNWGVITRAEVIALRGLASVPGAIYPVTLPDGRELTAMFSRESGPAVEAVPIKHLVPHVDADTYLPTIRMVIV